MEYGTGVRVSFGGWDGGRKMVLENRADVRVTLGVGSGDQTKEDG